MTYRRTDVDQLRLRRAVVCPRGAGPPVPGTVEPIDVDGATLPENLRADAAVGLRSVAENRVARSDRPDRAGVISNLTRRRHRRAVRRCPGCARRGSRTARRP